MRVKDICTREPRSCRPDANLAKAAGMMWDGDCGVVPIVDGEGKVLGMITDRDICMWVAFTNRKASEGAVQEAMKTTVRSCRPGDSVQDALALMRKAKVRRLPVTDSEGKLEGILSLNDVVLALDTAGRRGGSAALLRDLVRTLAAICEHPPGKPPEPRLLLAAN